MLKKASKATFQAFNQDALFHQMNLFRDSQSKIKEESLSLLMSR